MPDFVSSKRYSLLSDTIFIALASIFTISAYFGVLELTPHGIGMDSDLQNYAQILEWQKNPEAFSASDPIIATYKHFPGIPCFMTFIASLLGGEDAATSLFRAGALGLLLHFICFYIFGRWLLKKPSLAALLSILMSITVYWAYGTFWGATHSDPVPRIFHADCFALLLILVIKAFEKIKLRPLVMFLSGLSVAIHTVNGLACGLIFFLAFSLYFHNTNLKNHIISLFICAISFLLPSLLFLYSLDSSHIINKDYIYIFNEIFKLRFQEDWSHIYRDLLDIFLKYLYNPPIITVGTICTIILYKIKNKIDKNIKFTIYIFVACLISYIFLLTIVSLDIYISEIINKTHASQELLRATRLIIPLCWISIVSLFSYYIDKKKYISTIVVILLTLCLFIFSKDKQIICCRYTLSSFFNIPNINTIQFKNIQYKNKSLLDALDIIKKYNKHHYIYTDLNDMSVRYYLHMNLHHVLKDGLVIFYANDINIGKEWIKSVNLISKGKKGVLEDWKRSKAKFLLTKNIEPKDISDSNIKLLFKNEIYFIFEKI